MSRAARFFWVCAVSAVFCFVALAVMSLSTLELDGMGNFDGHLFGYTSDQARAYLALIEAMPDARALYLGAFRQLDTVFPVLLAISLSGALWLNTKGVHPAVRVILLLAPMGYLLMDMAENATVAQMVRVGSSVFENTIERASAYTQSKWALLTVSALLVIWAWRFASNDRRRTLG